MLGFESRVLDIKLLKFHAIWDNSAYKHDFQQKLVCQFCGCHWIEGIKTSPGVVLDLDYKSQLALHTKQGKVLTINFTGCFKKCDLWQTISNIDRLYIFGKYFSIRVWIQDCYLKIRLRLVQIHWQSFLFLHENMCQWSDTFFGNGGYHLDKEVKVSVLIPWIGNGSDQRWWSNVGEPRLPHARPTTINDSNWAARELPPSYFGDIWSWRYNVWGPFRHCCCWLCLGHEVCKEKERERDTESENAGKIERL